MLILILLLIWYDIFLNQDRSVAVHQFARFTASLPGFPVTIYHLSDETWPFNPCNFIWFTYGSNSSWHEFFFSVGCRVGANLNCVDCTGIGKLCQMNDAAKVTNTGNRTQYRHFTTKNIGWSPTQIILYTDCSYDMQPCLDVIKHSIISCRIQGMVGPIPILQNLNLKIYQVVYFHLDLHSSGDG